ncbi:MarR family winged helix-turn-helix transcriptional regulator [Rhodococcus sp. NPDC058521]|uniref:MarR family winged helix-turn-helix transcriptional regulator n=1 Tax=Rhodococcus sp. NPDC058521 TaxID=3346536 RepID=UPI003649AB27
MFVVEKQMTGYSCDVQQVLTESDVTRHSGVGAVHDELVRLLRQLVADGRPEDGAPTFAQHSLLTFVARNPGCRATDISDAFHVHRSTVSRQLRVCIDEGWVHAEPGPLRTGHPLTLTATGGRVLDAATAERLEQVADRLGAWSDMEIESFADLLRRFRRSADRPHAVGTRQ